MQLLAQIAQALVLRLGLGVGQEGIHALADALELGLPHDGFAKLAGLLLNGVLGLDICLHNRYCYATATQIFWQHFRKCASE